MIRSFIDKFHFEDIKNDIHPSIFFKHENYDLFILRVPCFEKSDELTFVSLAYVITDDSYYLYNRDTGDFIDLKNSNGFYKHLDKYIDESLRVVSRYSLEIEAIEDQIYQDSKTKDFNKKWFVNKTDLIRINRVLNKSVEGFLYLVNTYKNETDYLERNFEDLLEHIQRAHRNAAHLLEKLDSIHNFNLNQTNEQMNKIIYALTLLSGIFLPLNLIVGFFGMNTSALPFTQGSGGTYNVVLLLLVALGISVSVLVLFRKRRG